MTSIPFIIINITTGNHRTFVNVPNFKLKVAKVFCIYTGRKSSQACRYRCSGKSRLITYIIPIAFKYYSTTCQSV